MMPEFKYVARNDAGNRLTGSLKADTLSDAKAELRSKNLTIVSIEERGARRFSPTGKVPRPRIKLKDMAVFTRQLSTMISAGIPILEAMEVLSEQADDPGFRHVLRSICEEVRAGTDLSESMAHYSAVFEDLYTNMVRAGEASGQLDEILSRLAEYMESSESLRQEIKSALTYPAVSLFMILTIALILMIFVVPRFQKLFGQLERQSKSFKLPLPTKIMFGLSEFLRTKIYIWVPAVGGLILTLVLVSRGSKGSYLKDMVMLKMPVLGPLFHKVALTRFARTFSTLLQSGVPILATLDIVASTTGNKVLENAILRASRNIQEGEPLAVPLAQSGVFPKMVTRMVSIGERSGALETLLNKIADFYDVEVRATVKQLTSLIEPLMIAFMGIMVGGVVMAVFLPIFAAAGAMGRR